MKIEVKEGMKLRRKESVTLYWSHYSGLTTKQWTKDKIYVGSSHESEPTPYIVDDSGHCYWGADTDDFDIVQ